ncbi:hypothetical protein BDV3_001449 [Batrachochytrium dendrobatidis]
MLQGSSINSSSASITSETQENDAGIKNRILMMGGDSEHERLALVQEIMQKIVSKPVEPISTWHALATHYPSQSDPIPETDQVESLVYANIDTKYYQAEVAFQISMEQPWLDTYTEDTRNFGSDELCRGNIDAIVYVADKTQSIDQLYQILEWMKAYTMEFDTNISLLVVNDFAADVFDSQTELDEKCLDAGVELIVWTPLPLVDPLVATDPTSTLTSRALGSLLNADGNMGEEVTGLDRILEVLSINMWDGLKRKDEINFTGNNEGKGTISPPEQIINPSNDNFGAYTMADVDDLSKQLFGDMADEDGFERTLETLQKLRLQGEGMSEADRRTLAEKVALAFQLQLAAESDEENEYKRA